MDPIFNSKTIHWYIRLTSQIIKNMNMSTMHAQASASVSPHYGIVGELKDFDDLGLYEIAKQGPTGIPSSALRVPLQNFDIVVHNQKQIASSIERIPTLMGPPASQNDDLARIIMQLDVQREHLETNAQALSQTCRTSLELSQSAQPVLDELAKLRSEVRDLRREVNNQCCTVS
jgi:hypothetical protein